MTRLNRTKLPARIPLLLGLVLFCAQSFSLAHDAEHPLGAEVKVCKLCVLGQSLSSANVEGHPPAILPLRPGALDPAGAEAPLLTRRCQGQAIRAPPKLQVRPPN